MRAILAALAVVTLATACGAPAPPRTAAAPAPPAGPATLPAPTGPHRVGTRTMYVEDDSRPDPWDPDARTRRLKVTLWYPAERRDGEPAPYMTPKESELNLKGGRIAGVPYDLLSRTRTHAVKDAEPAGRELPLVVLSPGFTKPVSLLTSLAEDLASRGYAVAGIDHTHESYATTWRDGTVAECLACDSDTDPGFGARVVRGRAADVSFVLDRLADTGLVDPGRIAMAGQSIGGAAALAAMVTDPRVRAGIDLDGSTYARIPRGGLARPFMFVGTPQHGPSGGDGSWDRDWKLLTGWKRRLVVAGAEHQSFTDGPVLTAAFGVKPATGIMAAGRAVELTRTYVAAFLDRHLRGTRQPLLDGPSPRHPDVTFGKERA
ncbi:alpha/beta hydrolase family protein [Nonomuraea ceibae]|uniref:alpha/beta hydrolase family protein n=1 Tax=Nonomuraea ceibae TaxID=1935170 RepID=UPI001C5EA628|nr:alpha/beta hydrolase [Nonomuraea ceibae]